MTLPSPSKRIMKSFSLSNLDISSNNTKTNLSSGISSMFHISNITISCTIHNELCLHESNIHLYISQSIQSLTHQLSEQLCNNRKFIFQCRKQRKHREIRGQQRSTELHRIFFFFLRNELNRRKSGVFGLNQLESGEKEVGDKCFL